MTTLTNLDTTILPSLSDDQLANTTGGFGIGSVVKAGAKFAFKKVPLVGWAYSGYTGVKGYQDARHEGKSVGGALVRGAIKTVF